MPSNLFAARREGEDQKKTKQSFVPYVILLCVSFCGKQHFQVFSLLRQKRGFFGDCEVSIFLSFCCCLVFCHSGTKQGFCLFVIVWYCGPAQELKASKKEAQKLEQRLSKLQEEIVTKQSKTKNE